MSSLTRTESRTDNAARVARKILGDLQSLLRLYDCSNETEIQNYAHDIQLGLEHSCISSFRFYISSKINGYLLEAYEYTVNENGEIADASATSGRHSYNEKLLNSKLDVNISLKDRDKWEELKKTGKTKISWTPGGGKDLSNMSSQNDGAYKSGALGVSRTAYRSN